MAGSAKEPVMFPEITLQEYQKIRIRTNGGTMKTKSRITHYAYPLLVVPVTYAVPDSSITDPEYPAKEGNHG